MGHALSLQRSPLSRRSPCAPQGGSRRDAMAFRHEGQPQESLHGSPSGTPSLARYPRCLPGSASSASAALQRESVALHSVRLGVQRARPRGDQLTVLRRTTSTTTLGPSSPDMNRWVLSTRACPKGCFGSTGTGYARVRMAQSGGGLVGGGNDIKPRQSSQVTWGRIRFRRIGPIHRR